MGKIDKATTDITAVERGSIDVNYVYRGTTLIWQKSNFLLDNNYATGSIAAFSLRKLSSTYTGPAIVVRRASDNATQSINFLANGDLDQSAISTFCGASNGFVRMWLNQYPGGAHAIANLNNRQPQIYSSASGVFNFAGKPYMNFAGAQTFLVSNFSTPALYTHIISGSFSSYFVEHGDSTGDKFYCYSLGGSYVSATRTTKLEDAGALSFNGAGLKYLTFMVAGLTASLASGTYGTGGSLRLFEKAVEKSLTYRSPANERTLANNDIVTKNLNLFSRNQNQLFSTGQYFEILHFDLPKDYQSLSSIHSNIATYWQL